MHHQRVSRATGVIWITGFPGSGKTTVGRNVVRALDDLGTRSIFLDGDDLRNILGHKWGYSPEERQDLAKVFFRLSGYLSAQNYTVVIAAVAMYDSVFDWLRANVPDVMQVYLVVAEDIRRVRRARRPMPTTPGAQARAGGGKKYQVPSRADLVIDNSGAHSPSHAAERIVAEYMSRRALPYAAQIAHDGT